MKLMNITAPDRKKNSTVKKIREQEIIIREALNTIGELMPEYWEEHTKKELDEIWRVASSKIGELQFKAV